MEYKFKLPSYDEIWTFEHLYNAHKAARRGKRGNSEVINFEMNLSANLCQLSEQLLTGTYKMAGYYSFMVHDPKDRIIHALHYRDRVVQHCICDEYLAPLLDKHLIYDNSACRIGKGTHFALDRVSRFLRDYSKKYGDEGYILRCDIKKYFDNIDHNILKGLLRKKIKDERTLFLLDTFVDSYEKTAGKGLPLGNQTSQWFALLYLDEFDRLIKEKLNIKYYSRYMDDCVLIHHDKEKLKHIRVILESYLFAERKLEFNKKTEICNLKNGVDYLGFHFYLTSSGKVVRKIRRQTKYKFKRKVKHLVKAYADNKVNIDEVKQVLSSYNAHMKHGNTYKLRRRVLDNAVFCRKSVDLFLDNDVGCNC